MSFLFSYPKSYVRKPNAAWNPAQWASKIPFKHLNNFKEVFRALWENRDNLPYAVRVLMHGVCDGCALGTTGLKDWTIEGTHLCNVRLRLLRLNTIKPINPTALADVAPLKAMRSRDLRDLGRLTVPMIRRRGDAGFSRISWDEALKLVAERIGASGPDRSYFYLTSRGIPNETYYAAQKAVRALGTNNIDNAARVCHSPSTFALKAALGVGATTCSYTDLIGTDLITFFGSNVASNQPVMMKYLYHAKKAGTQIAVVNPYREPGMDAYWIPSDIESAMFGTRFTDHFFQVKVGGDIAFLHGVAKAIIAQDGYDHAFVEQHTAGFDELRAYLDTLTWDALEAASGVSRSEIERYAGIVTQAQNAIFVWGMGITQHTCGEDNVQAIVNLALLKGFVGRPGCGVMPIRGHSGVQGGAEMGAYATALPGGLSVTPENVTKLSAVYGFELPIQPGMTTPSMMAAAARGEIDVLFAVGGNFKEVLPDPRATESTLGKIPLRVHMDITVSSQMLTDPADVVLVLPARTRYEVAGGVTETSTERRVIFSPEIPGHNCGEARSEWDVLGEIAARLKPELADKVHFTSTQAIRDEIARVIPFYAGIEKLQKEGDQFQYGGSLLCKDWVFPTYDGKAHFHAPAMPDEPLRDGEFLVVTRRGKQFNSIVHEDKETYNGLYRDAVLINADDARRLGLRDGEPVRLTNAFGALDGKLAFENIASGAVQVYWPESNVLLDPTALSKLANIPAYKSGKAMLERRTNSVASEVRV